jgi:hypothetical protein
MTYRPIKTRFRFGFRCFSLTTPLTISRRLILQQAHGQVFKYLLKYKNKPSHCLTAYGFMFYFTPLSRFFFTVPSQYYFTIGHLGIFSLTRWSSQIHTGFHVPHATRDKKKKCFVFWLRDFHSLWCRIQLLHLIAFFFNNNFIRNCIMKNYCIFFPQPSTSLN